MKNEQKPVFLKLTIASGSEVIVNPKHIVWIEPATERNMAIVKLDTSYRLTVNMSVEKLSKLLEDVIAVYHVG